MKIVFLGQAKLSPRVQALSGLLAEAGHQVTVLGVKTRVRRIGQVELRSIWQLARLQPDVIHMYGWMAGLLALAVAVLANKATLVWTVEAIPNWPDWVVRWVIRGGASILDAITVTRREVQYHLLALAGVRATYIPDGFSPTEVATLSPRRWKVWPGRYCVASVSSQAEEEFVRKTYGVAGSKRPLVVVRLETSPRVAAALFREAAVILLFSENDGAERVLQAMASGRPIVALVRPFYEELLGVTARYVKMGDQEESSKVLREILSGKAPAFAPGMRGASKATAGKRRAGRHFRWERILADYLPLYRPAGRLVPLDSATLYPHADVAEWQTRTA